MYTKSRTSRRKPRRRPRMRPQKAPCKAERGRLRAGRAPAPAPPGPGAPHDLLGGARPEAAQDEDDGHGRLQVGADGLDVDEELAPLAGLDHGDPQDGHQHQQQHERPAAGTARQGPRLLSPRPGGCCPWCVASRRPSGARAGRCWEPPVLSGGSTLAPPCARPRAQSPSQRDSTSQVLSHARRRHVGSCRPRPAFSTCLTQSGRDLAEAPGEVPSPQDPSACAPRSPVTGPWCAAPSRS